MAEEKAKKEKRIKKKKWIQVLAPASFKKEIIGEIYAFETQSLIGRALTVNLMSLTRDMKQQNKNLKFVITGIEGDRAITELFGYYLTLASIRRLVRRGKKRIDLSFTCMTSDKKKVRMKALFIPNVKVKGSISSSLRKSAIASLSEHLSKLTFENAIRELMNYGLQRSLKSDLKKIYPIRILDISALYIEREKKPVEEKIEKVKVEEKAPEKEEKKEEKKEEVQGEEKEVILPNSSSKAQTKAEEVKVDEKAPKKEEKSEEKKEEVKEVKAEKAKVDEKAPKKEEKSEEKKEVKEEKAPKKEEKPEEKKEFKK